MVLCRKSVKNGDGLPPGHGKGWTGLRAVRLALAVRPGQAGASAPSCLGREATGRAGLLEGAYCALRVLKSHPQPPCRRRASVSRSAPRN